MADIVLTALYNAKQREFKLEGAGSSRFEADFIDAVNRAVGRMNNRADLATRIARITDTDDTVTNLDVKYEYVLSSGVTAFLMIAGQKPARGFEKQLAFMMSLFDEGIDEMMTDLRNDQQDSQGTDDDETDIIGLGQLG